MKMIDPFEEEKCKCNQLDPFIECDCKDKE
jgi:hypothetical protein